MQLHNHGRIFYHRGCPHPTVPIGMGRQPAVVEGGSAVVEATSAVVEVASAVVEGGSAFVKGDSAIAEGTSERSEGALAGRGKRRGQAGASARLPGLG